MSSSPRHDPCNTSVVFETFLSPTLKSIPWSILPPEDPTLPTPGPLPSADRSSMFFCYPWVPHAGSIERSWGYPLETPPHALLRVEGPDSVPIRSQAYIAYAQGRRSLPSRRNTNDTLPMDELQFLNLVEYLYSTDGNVTDFIFAKDTSSVAWARLKAAEVVFKLLTATNERLVFPALPADGAAPLSSYTRPPVAQKLEYSGADRQLFLQPAIQLSDDVPPQTFTTHLQNSFDEYEPQQLTFVHLEHLFRHLLLDKVLPYYPYIYHQDLKEGFVAHKRIDNLLPYEELTPTEISLLQTVSYFEFVGVITYLGSLLLQAAQHYSRILYEGVYLLLVRAYCLLGIFDWDQLNAKLFAQRGYECFGEEFQYPKRFQLDQYPGHAYSQHGWEYFKRRPHALGYLAELTQVAFFHGTEYLAPRMDKLRRNVLGAVESRVYEEEKALSDFFELPEKLTHKYHAKGFVTAVLNRDFKDMFGRNPPERPLFSTRNTWLKRGMHEYPATSNFIEEGGAQHELLVLSELNYSRVESPNTINEIRKAQAAKVKGSEALMRYSKYACQHASIALTIGDPISYGLLRFRGEPVIHRIDFYQYLTQRLIQSPCRIIAREIATKAFERLKQHPTASEYISQDPKDQFSLTFESYTRQVEDIQKQQDLLNVTELGANDDYYKLSLLLREAGGLETLWRDYAFPVRQIVADTVKFCFQIYDDTPKRALETLDTEIAARMLEGKKLGSTPVQPWEWKVPHETFLYYLGNATGTSIKDFNSVKKKGRAEQREEIINTLKRLKLDSGIKPTTVGMRPRLLYFVVPRRQASEQSGSNEVMYIAQRNDILYVSFSGHIGKNLPEMYALLGEERTSTVSFNFYENEFVPLKEAINHFPCVGLIDGIVDIEHIRKIANALRANVPDRVAYQACKRNPVVPAWMRPYSGANSARNLALLHAQALPSETLRKLVEVHGLTRVSTKGWREQQTKFRKTMMNEIQVEKKTLRADIELEQGERSKPYYPRFTRAQDTYILENVKLRLSKDKKRELTIVLERPIQAITARCRTLATKMLNEHKVFDVNVLPILNITKAIRLQVTKNLEEQVLKYPELRRAYMDTFHLHTEKELRDLFLKPQTTPASKVLTLAAARARVLTQAPSKN